MVKSASEVKMENAAKGWFQDSVVDHKRLELKEVIGSGECFGYSNYPSISRTFCTPKITSKVGVHLMQG